MLDLTFITSTDWRPSQRAGQAIFATKNTCIPSGTERFATRVPKEKTTTQMHVDTEMKAQINTKGTNIVGRKL